MGVSRSKWLVIGAVWLALTAAMLELLLPFVRDRYSAFFKRGLDASAISTAGAQRFVDSKAFDPELGWNSNPAVRNYVPTKRYLAQAYGDSFTRGAAKLEPENTWQEHFERLTGQGILNLGVSGYGLDQAVLKFEKYGHQYPTRIAILGLYSETFRRALAYHSFYYFQNKEEFLYAFKPIFVKREGRYELIRPPCADAACLLRVLSDPPPQIQQTLSRDDYWYQVNARRPTPGFPNTLSFARALPEIIRSRRAQPIFVSQDSLDVVEYLIDRFAQTSRKLGMKPVYLMLYSASHLRTFKAGVDNPLPKLVAAHGVSYVDTAAYILDRYKDDDGFAGLVLPDGHLNSRGNLMVAEALAAQLQSVVGR